VRAGELFEIEAEPIRNPVTGKPHRVRIDLPEGFEYDIAEVGAGTSRARGDLVLDLTATYAQFARLHMDNRGPVRHRTGA
jgi:hypothetical protein